jgi:hypothetical protein
MGTPSNLAFAYVHGDIWLMNNVIAIGGSLLIPDEVSNIQEHDNHSRYTTSTLAQAEGTSRS